MPIMSKEWDKENMKTISCRVRKEEADAFKQYAESCGMSAHTMLSGFVRSAISSNDGMIRSLSAENQKLAAELAQKTEELKQMKEIIQQYNLRACRAEELVRKYVLEK